jgi:adenylyltransferase/sulfurtransferase
MTEPFDHRGLPPGHPLRPEYEIAPRDAAEALKAGALLLDCRTPAEWEASHVPGATLIPLHELADRLDEIEQHRDGPVCVMCHTGVRSLKATVFLQQNGFDGARSVAGGIDLWSKAVDPSIPRYVKDMSGCRVIGP